MRRETGVTLPSVPSDRDITNQIDQANSSNQMDPISPVGSDSSCGRGPPQVRAPRNQTELDLHRSTTSAEAPFEPLESCRFQSSASPLLMPDDFPEWLPSVARWSEPVASRRGER